MSQVGKYLNLKPHMQSWAVYNENGPYTSANAIGSLAPAQFGGLSYEILAEKGGDVYVIQTESFGRCAIWAPRDNDSSITSTPAYTNGGSSGGGGTGGGNGGIEIPGGLKVFIDPGHGGYDPGALGNGLQEKDVVLAISKKLGMKLNSYGISVQYSRTTDTFVDLDPRAQQANNWGANLFVSIHANSATASASGTECYTKPAADSKTKQLSANVAQSISSKLGISNRGHKEEVWRVLMSSNMPAILVETAFISNSGDANLLKNRQDDFANTIAEQIAKYLNVTAPKPPDKVAEINNFGFAKLLGTRFTTINQSIPIGTVGALRITLENSTQSSTDNNIIAEFENGRFVGGTLKNKLTEYTLDLSNLYNLEITKTLLELGDISFSIAAANKGNTITISFEMSSKLSDSTNNNQTLIMEFNKEHMKASAAEAANVANEFVRMLTPVIGILIALAGIIAVYSAGISVTLLNIIGTIGLFFLNLFKAIFK